MNDRITIGEEKVSVTIVRKTSGDLLITQLSFERWFDNEREADLAMSGALAVLTGKHHGE